MSQSVTRSPIELFWTAKNQMSSASLWEVMGLFVFVTGTVTGAGDKYQICQKDRKSKMQKVR